jgi:hypothetical protein
MGQPKTLTDTQVALLRWIAGDCPPGVMTGTSHRISAAALSRRGLAAIAGHGALWRATITPAGRAYLRQVDGPSPPRARRTEPLVSKQLVDEVLAGGGSLRVPAHRFDPAGEISGQRRVALADRGGWLAEGKRLTLRRLTGDEMEIELLDAPAVEVAPEVRRVTVPGRVARYHPVVRWIRDRPERQEVSRAQLPRALRLLQGLVAEAERRGYGVEVVGGSSDERGGGWSGPRRGHLTITVRGTATAIRVLEEGLPSRAYWQQHNTRWDYSPGGRSRSVTAPISEYEAKATGRLRLEVPSSHGRADAYWADRKAAPLDGKLGEVLAYAEAQALATEERQRAAELQAIERRQLWEEAMGRARTRFIEHVRAEHLQTQVDRWRQAQEIRAYCAAASSAYPDDADTAAWVTWSHARADHLDPLNAAPAIPRLPEEIRTEDLKPFMERGFSPYGPDARW